MYIVPKSTNESRERFSPEPAEGQMVITKEVVVAVLTISTVKPEWLLRPRWSTPALARRRVSQRSYRPWRSDQAGNTRNVNDDLSSAINDQLSFHIKNHTTPPPPHHNHFTALFPGPPGWAGARREFLDFMVQGKINRGRHTDHLAGRHSIQTNQCPPPPPPYFLRPDALPAAQPTVSKHSRQLAHSD